MRLANPHFRPSRVLAACCLLGLSACAHHELNDQLGKSQEAINQARAAGAAEMAPSDYNAANSKMRRARSEDTVVAMRLAEEAQADANLAHAKTNSTRAMNAATEMARSNQALREEINRSGQKQQR